MKKIIYLMCLTFLTFSCTNEKQQNDAPKPFIPLQGNWVYDTTISDEFEGAVLDSNKWYDHNAHWIGRQPSLFMPHNVKVEDGKLILTGKREEVKDAPEGFNTFTSAAVQGKKMVLYGYFEIECKVMESALSSAFWLNNINPVKEEELDIFEVCGRYDNDPSFDSIIFATSHYIVNKETLNYHMGVEQVHVTNHTKHKVDYRTAERKIVSGLKWTRKEIIWYVNGKEIQRIENHFWHSPEMINFDSEAFPNWWGLPSETDNGGTFEIDYFRYWKDMNENADDFANEGKK